jgi:hypothetical protein
MGATQNQERHGPEATTWLVQQHGKNDLFEENQWNDGHADQRGQHSKQAKA